MSNDLNIVNITTNASKGRMKKRISAIRGKDNISSFVLEDLSNGWPISSKESLLTEIHRIQVKSHKDWIFTDIDQIRDYLYRPVPRDASRFAKNPKAIRQLRNTDLGLPVATNIACICTGCAVIDHNTRQLLEIASDESRSTILRHGSIPGHLGWDITDDRLDQRARVNAHGPTFGTLYVKVLGKRFENGKFLGPSSIKMAVLCNNCVNRLVGKYVRGQARNLDLIPDCWKEAQDTAIAALEKRVNDAKSRLGSNTLPPRESIKERKVVTNDVLRQRLGKEGVATKRNLRKDDLVLLCGKHGVSIN